MRSRKRLCSLILACLWPVEVLADGGRLADPNEDFSAHRIDTEVFGWNKDYTEMAAMGIDVRRFPDSKQRGEGFMVVFKVGSITPIHNVKVLHITQAAAPHDPLPIEDVRKKMWGIDYSYQRLWPKRPKQKKFKGAMDIEPLWVPVEVEPRICRPAVGFLLRHRGQVRYQPHELMKMKASCSLLRMTDQRTYWAKADLGATMIRFDYSASRRNEQSIRFPLAAAWSLAKPLNIILESGYEKSAAETKTMVSTLRKFGAVSVQPRTQRASAELEILPAEDTRFLAHQLAQDVRGEVVHLPAPDGADMVVRLGPTEGR